MSTSLLAAEYSNHAVYVVVGLAAILLAFLMPLLILFTKYYKRCPSNRILVISGKTSSGADFECHHGGAVFVVPMLQQYAWLSLEPIRVTVSARPLLKCGSIEFHAPQIFSVAIGVTEELMANAAARLLGLGQPEIVRHAEDIIACQLDRLVDRMQSGEAPMDPEEFHRELEKSVESELNELGLTLLNFRRE